MKPTGGAAFPCDKPYGNANEGMTLRDYFAAAALQGVLKDRENVQKISASAEIEKKDRYQYLAEEMYAIADAFLIERYK